MSRITIDLRMYRHSGIGRYLQSTIPLLLPRLEARAIRVVTTPGLVDGETWLGDARVEHVEVKAGVYSVAEQGLASRGTYRGTDLLWVPHYNVPLAYSGKLAVTIHDLAPIALPETFSSEIKRAYARLLIGRAVARSAAIVTVSQFTASELKKLLKADTEKITVTYPGLDPLWARDAEAHREPDGAPYLLYVGNVKPNKNLKLLVGAFLQVKDRMPHRLVLAGRMRGLGTEDTAVLRQAKMLGNRVRWTGEVPDAELVSLYAGADALVMPSLYEGFGLTLLEAMQMKCPVLCSDAGSLPEVGGDAALYFNPRDESDLMKRLLQVADRGLMDDLRSKGRRRAMDFSSARCAAQTATVMNETMRKR